MAKVGDRVVVEGSKVGGGRREGTLTQVVGSLIKVRWGDGAETLIAPGAGAVQFLPGTSKSGKVEKATKPAASKASSAKAAASGAGAAKKKGGAKKK